jgi:hypothetical protein
MAIEFADSTGPGVGLQIKNRYATVWNRMGATPAVLGDLVMFDMGDTDTDTTTSLAFANDGSVLANVIAPTSAIVTGSGMLNGTGVLAPLFFGVVVDLLDGAGADNTKIRIQVSGIVKKASMVATAIVVGVGLSPALSGTAARQLSPIVGVSQKVIAIAWEPNGSAAGQYQCLFDGIGSGFAGGAFAN